MGTENIIMFAQLAAKFVKPDVRFKRMGGKEMPYITARHVMNRLDDVVGPENWWDEYSVISATSVVCKLTIVLPGGEVVTKQDVGGMTDMADSSDSEKSGFSDAFKRAAVKFGIGRHLYGDGVPQFVRDVLNARQETPEMVPDRSHAARVVEELEERPADRAAMEDYAPPPVVTVAPATARRTRAK